MPLDFSRGTLANHCATMKELVARKIYQNTCQLLKNIFSYDENQYKQIDI